MLVGGSGIGDTCVANALFHVYVCVGNYTLPLDHSIRTCTE